MHTIFFWKNWTSFYQRLFWLCASFLIVSLLYLWVSNEYTPGPVLKARHYQELEPQEIPVHVFKKGATSFSITSENYLVFDHLFGSELQPNQEASYLFLGLLLTGIIIMLSILTTLPRFWFYMGMGLFILCIVSFRLESLELLGITNKMPIVAILLLYGFAGYYFQFLRPSEPLIRRLAVFLVITGIIGFVVVYFSKIPAPLYYLSANGLMAATILTILFIFTVAHEIIASFVVALTSGKKPTKSLRHFLLISAIYLTNLVLVYADKKHLIAWNFFPLSLFLLLTVSGLLGIWGFRQREPLYENIMRANPIGTYFFIALAGIGFSTIGYFLATANDPAIQVMKDAILYSHLGYGLIFLVYIIANFISLLGANLQVYKVLYKPSYMPYFTFRLAGLIATFAFFAYSNYQVSVNQIYAGYYNAMGDYYLSQDTSLLAEGYYKKSTFHATRNYHAHYALAELRDAKYEFENENDELKKLANGRPLDLGYLNQSRLYEASNLWNGAIDVLKSGLIDFPKNGLLQNELGLNYIKLGKEDSAILMITSARETSSSKSAAETNLMGVSAYFKSRFPSDSLVGLLDADNPGVVSNALALASIQGRYLEVPIDAQLKNLLDPQVRMVDTVLTPVTVAKLNNYLLNHLSQTDTALVAKIIRLVRMPSNDQFKNILLSSAAHAYYESGEIMRAIRLMHEIAFMGRQPKCYNTLGLWCLEQGAPEMAVHYFEQALLKDFHPADFNRALALAEAADIPQALIALDSLPNQKDTKRIKQLLTILSNDALTLSDEEKFEFSRLRFSVQQQPEFIKFITTIPDQKIRIQVIIDRCLKLEEADEIETVLNMLASLKDSPIRDNSQKEALVHLQLRSLARAENPDLSVQLKSNITYPRAYQQEVIYYQALENEQSGKKDSIAKNKAAKQFEWLAIVNPFFEDAVIAAARFDAENGSDKLKPYNIIVSALDVNPNSVKLLKAYFVYSARLDFDEPAKETLEKLHKLLTREAFAQFAKENPDIFEFNRN